MARQSLDRIDQAASTFLRHRVFGWPWILAAGGLWSAYFAVRLYDETGTRYLVWVVIFAALSVCALLGSVLASRRRRQ